MTNQDDTATEVDAYIQRTKLRAGTGRAVGNPISKILNTPPTTTAGPVTLTPMRLSPASSSAAAR